MRFNQIKYKQTEADKKLVLFIHERKREMSTFYREKAVRLAKWARDDYEGTSDETVSNLQLMKVPLSIPAVNQRCSILFNNQSKADYRTVDESKKYDVEILKEVDAYDKKVGKFNSAYQDIEMTANIEGSCFFRVNWEEKLDKMGNTIGVPHVGLKRVRMNDIWWDQSARTMDECNHMLERKKMSYERFLRMFVPMEGREGFKNVRAVIPMAEQDCEGEIWQEDWERYSEGKMHGDKVTLWYFETLGMIVNGEIKKKSVIVANGVVIYESDDLFVPCKPGQEPMLSWNKIDGIPTGHMVGLGIPVLIRHPQEAFDRLLTLAIAQAEIAVVPPVVLGPNIDWDTDDNPLVAGKVIRSINSAQDVRNSYHWFQAPDITQGAQVMMEKIIEYVIMLTGVDIRALFVAPSEKAITTVNKREIQEKLLRFSVQWNEENGYYGLALLRLRFMQCYYPKERTFLAEEGGQYVQKKGHLKIPLKDYETEEVTFKNKKKIKLNFKEGGYTNIDITPENIDFNVDIVIEGATTWQEGNSIEKKNFLDGLQVANSIPAFQKKIDENPDKFLKMLVKKLNMSESDLFEEPKKNNQNQHPALKEIAAINLIDAFDEDLTEYFDIDDPEKYDPAEYVDIFSEVMRTNRYAGMTKDSKKLFDERFQIHEKNARNPYFYDILEKKQEEEDAKQQTPPEESAVSTGLPEQQQEPQNLMDRMKSESAQVANLTK